MSDNGYEQQAYELVSAALDRVIANRTGPLGARSGGAAGFQYGTRRDYYKVLGWKKDPVFADFNAMFNTSGIAEKVVTQPAEDTWRDPPDVVELVNGIEDRESPFVTALTELDDQVAFWAAMEQLDILTGIGEYGVMVLGLNDGGALDQPVTRSLAGPEDLLYLWGFDQGKASVESIDNDPTSPRYGLPEAYKISIDQLDGRSSEQIYHWSRVIHVAERTLRDRVHGIPRLRSVYNEIQDATFKVVGGASEAIWRLVYKGMIASPREGFRLPSDQDSKAELEGKIQALVNDLTRFVVMDGMDIQELGGEVVDPSGQFGILMTIISLKTGIPKRLLMGSELGELASTQDAVNWAGRVKSRRRKHAEPNMIKPTVNRLVQYGILPQPAGIIKYQWSPLFELTPVQMAEAAERFAAALMHYTGGKGGTPLTIVSPREFREALTPWTRDMSDADRAEVKEILDAMRQVPENAADEITQDIADDLAD